MSIFINMNKLSLNLLTEQIYIISQVNRIYENILREEEGVDPQSDSIIKGIATELKLSSKFIFQFGTGIGALMGPVTELLTNGGVSITKEEVVLLIITALAIIITSDSVEIGKLEHEVEQKGLERELGQVSKFMLNTKKLMSTIGQKVGRVVHTLSDILGFTFMLVPTMNVLRELINTYHVDMGSFGQLLGGLTAAAGSYGIKTIVDKIMKKKGLRESDFDWTKDIQPMKPGMEFLKDNFDNLQKVINGDQTYYVDSDREPLFMYYQDLDIGVVWVSYDRIWSVLEKDFGLNQDEIQGLIKEWLRGSYKLRRLTPMRSNHF
jgi:hypothetical protein